MAREEYRLHAALMAKIEELSAAEGLPVMWPRKGGDKPNQEYISVYRLPNTNRKADLASNAMRRQGFLIITLVSDLSQHESVSLARAGDIASYFYSGDTLEKDGQSVEITDHTIRGGRENNQRWETPIWIGYWTIV